MDGAVVFWDDCLLVVGRYLLLMLLMFCTDAFDLFCALNVQMQSVIMKLRSMSTCRGDEGDCLGKVESKNKMH